MNPPIETIPIDSITVGDRLRTDHGDIDALATSIADHGLLHPIVVDDADTLIAGERRLRALRQLGFEAVPVRRWGQLDARQRREIELEENLQRKDLTPAERSRKLIELVEVAEQVLASEVSTDSVKTSKDGRPPKRSISEDKIADHIGVPKQTIRDAEKHIVAMDSYPLMAHGSWRQYHAMKAAEGLEKLPEDERSVFTELIGDRRIQPRDAIKMLHNLVTMPEPDRKEILALAQSADARDRDRAQTTAAALPPRPDPRLEDCDRAVRALKQAVKSYPKDPEVKELKRIIKDITAVADAIRQRSRHVDGTAQ